MLGVDRPVKAVGVEEAKVTQDLRVKYACHQYNADLGETDALYSRCCEHARR